MLFLASIEEFDEDVDLMFVDVGFINDVDDVFLSKDDGFLIGDSLAFVEKDHRFMGDGDLSADDGFDLTEGESSGNRNQEGLLLIGSKINVNMVSKYFSTF